MKYALLFFTTLLLAAGADLDQARKLYNRTDFDGSLKILEAVAQKTPEVNLWIGRNLYMLGEYKKATEVLQKAVAGAPANSDAYLWLGRALGRRAETSSVLPPPATPPRRGSISRRPRNSTPQPGGAQRPLRVLPGSPRIPGRRHGQGNRHGGTDCATQSRGRPLGAGQAG